MLISYQWRCIATYNNSCQTIICHHKPSRKSQGSVKSSLSQSSFSFSRSSCHCQQDALNRLTICSQVFVEVKFRWCRTTHWIFSKQLAWNWNTYEHLTLSCPPPSSSHHLDPAVCDIFWQRINGVSCSQSVQRDYAVCREFLTNLTLLKRKIENRRSFEDLHVWNLARVKLPHSQFLGSSPRWIIHRFRIALQP